MVQVHFGITLYDSISEICFFFFCNIYMIWWFHVCVVSLLVRSCGNTYTVCCMFHSPFSQFWSIYRVALPLSWLQLVCPVTESVLWVPAVLTPVNLISLLSDFICFDFRSCPSKWVAIRCNVCFLWDLTNVLTLRLSDPYGIDWSLNTCMLSSFGTIAADGHLTCNFVNQSALAKLTRNIQVDAI